MWKEIPGYEGYYEVNENGLVRGVTRRITRRDGRTYIRKARALAPKVMHDGYLSVNLCKDGEQRRFYIHRLVAFLFVDGYNDGLEVNHKDCNRQNNKFDNLEWVSHQDNIKYTKSLKRHVSDRDLTGANNPNYHNHTLHDRFQNEPELRMVQSRSGAKNGRARAIRAYLPNGEALDFSYIGECAKYLIAGNYTKSKNINSVSTYIRRAAESGGLYRNLRFEMI